MGLEIQNPGVKVLNHVSGCGSGVFSGGGSNKPTVRKVRITVKDKTKFRRSPVKNDNLQVEIKRHSGKKLSLIRDSLHAMLERFLKLSESINKMLDEYNLTSLKLETRQLQTMEDIVVALEPFKVATTYLCDQKCDISKAEEIIGFISGEL